MRTASVPAGLASVVVFTAWSLAQQPGGDLERLQGTWRAVRLEAAGEKVRDVEKTGLTLTLRGDRYVEQVKGKTVEEGAVTLKPDTRPKQIDIRIGTGKDKGKTQLGIYKLDGDTATFAIAPAGSTERPTDFAPRAGSKYGVQVFRREKK